MRQAATPVPDRWSLSTESGLQVNYALARRVIMDIVPRSGCFRPTVLEVRVYSPDGEPSACMEPSHERTYGSQVE